MFLGQILKGHGRRILFHENLRSQDSPFSVKTLRLMSRFYPLKGGLRKALRVRPSISACTTRSPGSNHDPVAQTEAGSRLDGGVFPLLMSIARIGSTETRRGGN